MRELTLEEINDVSGGDAWAGTAEGRAPAGPSGLEVYMGGAAGGILGLIKALMKN